MKIKGTIVKNKMPRFYVNFVLADIFSFFRWDKNSYLAPRLRRVKQKTCIFHCWASRWFFLFYSPKPRSHVWIYKENNSSARASRFLVHFFDVHWTTTTWNLLIWSFMEEVDIQRRFFLPSLNLHKILKNSTPGKVACILNIERV